MRQAIMRCAFILVFLYLGVSKHSLQPPMAVWETMLQWQADDGPQSCEALGHLAQP